jgi:hypothetical protein
MLVIRALALACLSRVGYELLEQLAPLERGRRGRLPVERTLAES